MENELENDILNIGPYTRLFLTLIAAFLFWLTVFSILGSENIITMPEGFLYYSCFVLTVECLFTYSISELNLRFVNHLALSLPKVCFFKGLVLLDYFKYDLTKPKLWLMLVVWLVFSVGISCHKWLIDSKK